MDKEELKQEIRSALEEGYSPEEVVKALRQNGYSDEVIKEAVREIKEDIKD